jgi:pyruvate formate lyase activating enzyme
MSADELLSVVERDCAFYGNIGGVTLSGGEPLMQGENTVELLRACKEAGFSTAVETCGYADSRVLRRAAEFVDLFLWDIKDTNDERHKKYTGVSNKKILENLSVINEMGAKIRLRCILVNGVNTDKTHYKSLAEIAGQIKNFDGIEIIPYHAYGGTKSVFLGFADSGKKEWIPTEEEIAEAKNILKSNGVKVF